MCFFGVEQFEKNTPEKTGEPSRRRWYHLPIFDPPYPMIHFGYGSTEGQRLGVASKNGTRATDGRMGACDCQVVPQVQVAD